MQVVRRFGTVGFVFLVAFGTGYVMQNAEAIAARFGGGEAKTASFVQAGQQLPTDPASRDLTPPATQTYALSLPEA
ncbi:hypothetical protein [Tropicimonas sp. IMCC6043]|uniref:hypothetical protein n=1 Tax=Tropicimonas sp. IMCC6043 TaxID=2510645 RepID=UPI00101C0589|nr:hypothetical protein [Tropicimonas sp. IMCC6043]RYH09889.1 hypothetical protein EU800_10060 [Tropicimonas sp. IMCC6043]